jgi:PST family polysaccharide transporter
MDELSIAAVLKRSVRGVVALVSRTFIIQGVTFGANLLLTIFLAPEIFGVYFVVTACIAFLSYFSDIGLAAALIQKKGTLKREEVVQTFTLQQLMVVTLCVIALGLSPLIADWYQLDFQGMLLFQMLVISFFLSSLKTIPSVLLERELRFDTLVIPQILETIVFNVVAVVCAIQGFGVASFTYAVLLRGISGVVVMYLVAPWRIGISFSFASIRSLLSFGIPFQLNSVLALVKDDLLVVYLGRVLPLQEVGFIGFAQKWALMPLRLVMDNVIRITFPSYSRLQHEKVLLGKAIEMSLFLITLAIFPVLTAMVLLAPVLFQVIPRYEKWEPAVMALGLFALQAAISSISTPLTNALNAIGRIKTTLSFMLGWTIATWVITPLAVWWLGYNGVAIASAVISLSVVLIVWITRRVVNFSLVSVYKTALSAVVMALVMYGVDMGVSGMGASWVRIFLVGIAGSIMYALCIWFLLRRELWNSIERIRKHAA